MTATHKGHSLKECPVHVYAEKVLDGEIVTGELVRLACERHVRDLKQAKEKGFYLDHKAEEFALRLFEHLPHTKGQWAGEPFDLSLWQGFVVGSLFGWKWLKTATRRFRIGYVEVARKQGKSTLAAGVGIIAGFFDDEPGAETYSAATKRDQARIVFEEAKRMVNNSPVLKKYIRPMTHVLYSDKTNSKFEALGADKDSSDGLNIHCAIIDELHAHKTRGLFDVLLNAQGARRQPLTFVITYAGFDKNSVCWEQHAHTESILRGGAADETFFGYIASLDPGDDWRDEKVWPKANPNLGISVNVEGLRAEAERAKQIPGLQNDFRRAKLNEWTEQEHRWLDVNVWDEAGEGKHKIEKELAGRACWGGLDLASTRDLNALLLVFPDLDDLGADHPGFYLLPYFWIPEEGLKERVERDRVPYNIWRDQGFLTTTPGNTTDHRFIEKKLEDLVGTFVFKELAFDASFSAAMIPALNEILPPAYEGRVGKKVDRLIRFRQGPLSMSPGVREIEALVLERKLYHGGNPILRWNAANAVLREDHVGNKMIDRQKSIEKVDGLVALCMALARAIVRPAGSETTGSIYDQRGIDTL